MERHFEKELNKIRTHLNRMSGLTLESLTFASRTFLEHDVAFAEHTFKNERDINSLEIEIDHLVADCFALFQPVAVDLRFLLAVSKINNDLERIGDHCVNIAQSAITCCSQNSGGRNLQIPRMIETAQSMLEDAMSSFFAKDLQVARTVLESDDILDELNRTNTREAIQLVKSGEIALEPALELLRISRNLERIGDLSTNLAEEVIFHVQARVVKHHHEELPPI